MYYFKHMGSIPVVFFLFALFLATQPFRAAGDEFFGEFATTVSEDRMSVSRFLELYISFMVSEGLID